MATIKTSFTRKLHIAFGLLLLTTAAIAWYFWDSARWFAVDARRIGTVSETLGALQDLSSETYRTLFLMTEATERGTATDAAGFGDDEALRAALAAAREGLSTEAALQENDRTGPRIELLAELEAAVATVTTAAAAVERDLAAGDQERAQATLARLRSEGAASRFGVLMERAIADQQVAVTEASEQAVSLAGYVTRLLPLVVTVLVAFTVFVVWRFSLSLQRSIGALHQAADEYTGGNLQHRIPDIDEREFYELGRAFNAMAGQLAEHRAELRDANVRLEGMIEERTRALKESNDKLAKVDENRRRLLADISHEFRTPLTVIRGESEIALRGKDRKPEEYRESLERIIDTADYATSLVEDLLFIVRADAGEPRLDMQNLELTELVKNTCEDFRAKAGRRNIEIVHHGGDGRATLRGDPRRLRQVFGILLDNALRYSHEGGTIEVTLTTDDKEATVQVRDEGIGLTEEEASQAFQRFFRGQQATAHAQQGTGLGLPVAKAIVDAHQGSIGLTGKPGEGAVATVTLPVEGSLRAVA